MSAFDAGADPDQDLGLLLLRDSAVTLFYRAGVLDRTVAWLADHGYQVIELHASSWTADEDLHRHVARELSFPDYYGQNLDALNDCLHDVVRLEYGWDAHATGLVLVFTGYDAFTAKCPRSAQIVLDLVAQHSRVAALFGRRLVCLVQSDDPLIGFDPVGACPVVWNDAEWPDSSRS